MWETFISWYINTYLGKYVENLNSQQLSFALRQGELELENVPLKKNIFRSWGLPVEVRSGVVGRIRIEFNILKYFRNEPVLISIEDIYLVAGPLNLSEWDPMEEEILSQESKMNSLDGHEARWKAHNDLAANASSYYSSLYFSSMRIGASIVTKVVENLQLNVKNVHFRFESEMGDSRHRTIAFGMTLESLSAQSCDSHWNPLSSVHDCSFECSYKTLQLRKLGFYCDTKAEKFSHYKPHELKAAMNKLTVTHDYILCPVSAEARIAKNNSSNPLQKSSKARFDVHLTLEKVPLQLSDSQYRQSTLVFKAFRRLERNCRLRHYRPFVPVNNNVRDWWQYAIRAVLTIRGYKRRKKLNTWEEVLERGRDNVAYVNAYEQHLLRELLSSDDRKLKDRIEYDLHYDEIILLREIAMTRVQLINTQPCDQTQEVKASSSITPTNTVQGSENENSSPTSEISQNQSVMGWLFPSWANWVSGSDGGDVTGLQGNSERTVSDELVGDKSSSRLSVVSETKLHQSESDFDEAILDDMKAYGRDALLARFHFILKQGNITIKKKSGPFLEFEFSGVDLRTEIRPRSGAHKFQMTLSSVYLRDFSTKSLIISPHSPKTTKGVGLGSKTSHKEVLEPLFRLTYERKPQQKTSHKVSVTAKPLDLVIYPQLREDLAKFFSVNSKQDELESPHNGYEAMKQRTKEEIRTYWEKLINQHEGSSLGGGAPSWDIVMDISAPQIVVHGANESRGNIKKMYSSVPETRSSQTEKKLDTLVGPYRVGSSSTRRREVEPFLVIDLGRFRFSNLSGNYIDNLNTKMADNAPEVFSPNSCANSPRQSISDISEAPTVKSPDGDEFNSTFGDIHAKLYKKYRLEITDVQILVIEGKAAKEGYWRNAVVRGASQMHLIDKFSIDLQLERRLIHTDDPRWPALTLVATLPKWNLHFNETKILTIRTVLGSFFSISTQSDFEEMEKLRLSFMSGSQINLQEEAAAAAHNQSLGEGSKIEGNLKGTGSSNKKSDCKLFLAQFTIQNVTVEIQSGGRSIAELQIIGAKTSFTARPMDTSISFVIQSLLLADAIQTFGPDFELLLASHKHVSMDSVSGSLRDSEPASPLSPQSPGCPSPGPYLVGNQLAIPSQLHDALVTTLQAKHTKAKSQELPFDAQIPVSDVEALITAELVLVNTDEDLAILSVQFNNLDLIANQETIVEILQFLQRAFPSPDSVPEQRPKSETKIINTGRYRLQSSFDFHRLNILLVRGVMGKDGNQCARKIATATASDARVNLSVSRGLDITIEGSLGGLQMLNLTPEGQRHQRIISVGQDPLVDESYSVFSHASVQSAITEQLLTSSNLSALTFSFDKPAEANESNPPFFKLRMASVIYTHCPTFLIDLKKCISEFQAPLATKLRSAAAHIALGLVRQDGPSTAYRSPVGSLSGSLDKLNVDEENINRGDGLPTETPSPIIQLDIILDSPVMVLPKSRNSPRVLVANLGQITVSGNNRSKISNENGHLHNSNFDPPRCSTPDMSNQSRRSFDEDFDGVSYSVFICDVSLYSVDLTEKWNMMENLKYTFPTSTTTSAMKAQELYYCDPETSIPILHNTVIQISICYAEDPPFVNASNLESMFPNEDAEDPYFGPKLELHGRVVNPLKVSLTPLQYSQILDSLNNISADSDDLSVNELDIMRNPADARRRWREEVNSHRSGIYQRPLNPLPLPSPTRGDDDSLPISASFEVPELIVELVLPEVPCKTRSRAKFGRNKVKKEQPRLCLSCSDLSVECDKKGYITEMKLNLKSLTLEDTSVPSTSPQRFLAMSNTSLKPDASEMCTSGSSVETNFFRLSRFVSSSCPDLPKSVPILVPETPSYYVSNSYVRSESSSLPDHLDPTDIFSARFFAGKVARSSNARRKNSFFLASSDRCSEGKPVYPATPPPSPRATANTADTERFVNLVHIDMCLVDSKSPNFISKYHGTHKFVNVDFNALEVLLTPETFICLRRFFSEANKIEAEDRDGLDPLNEYLHTNVKINKIPEEAKGEDEKNTETKINVKALSVKIAKSHATLAEGRVTGVMCNLVNRGKDFFGVEGRLGSLQIKDVSSNAGKYPVKFTFQGKQALDFDYFRKKLEAKFRLQMSSVVCIHTQRFYTEFSSLISTLFGSVSAVEESDTQTGNIPTTTNNAEEEKPSSVRVSLDIQAGAPVLLFPYSSTSRNLLVADLGHLSVKNKIVEESKEIVCDIVSVDLIEMDLFAAELQYNASSLISQMSKENLNNDILKIWILDKNRVVVKTSESTSFLKEKCALKLKMKRFLAGAELNPSQAATSIEGTLSTVCCFLDPEKYKLVRGLLEFNIGEKLESQENGVSTPMRTRVSSMSGGIVSDSVSLSGSVPPATRKELVIELDLVNVTLELIKDTGTRLSRVDFIKSKFTFQNNSDGTRDVDLASQEILISDARFKNDFGDSCSSMPTYKNIVTAENVFTNILQQSSVSGVASTPLNSSGVGSGSFQSNTYLQAEIHYRLSPRGSSITIVLNNMRLMLILDWWMELRAFLSQKGPAPASSISADDESNKNSEIRLSASPLLKRSRHTATPITVSADPSVWDTNAVILKSTAVLNYKPHLERPVTCTLLQCELFSCILGLESDTALSIVDPTDINFELVRKIKSEPQGILDATLSPSNSAKTLRVQSPQICLRLSYYDMKMFVHLIERFSKQAQVHLLHSDVVDLNANDDQLSTTSSIKRGSIERACSLDETSMQYLLSMGFSRQDSEEALYACGGRLDDAAIYLTSSTKSFEFDGEVRETSPISGLGNSTDQEPTITVNPASEGLDGQLSDIEIKCSFLSLCVIDDCKDADVPLLEVAVTGLELVQNCLDNSGQAECHLSADYYNRELSGWEPVLESWKCLVLWKKNEIGQLGLISPGNEFPTKSPELELSVSSRQVMNINITSTLLNLYKTVSLNWSEEYNQQKMDRRRAPFVPFLLKNETGSELWFSTILPNNDDLIRQQRNLSTGGHSWTNGKLSGFVDGTSWINVPNGNCHAFSFEGRGKLRHRNTHQLRTHQLAVRVDGWHEIVPVSLDKVGTYFRVAKPTVSTMRYGTTDDLPFTRLVFEVTLLGSAQKLVLVRSALLLKNCLNEDIELKLENTIVYPSFAKEQTGGSFLAQVKSGESYPIPLHSVWAQLWVRPTTAISTSATKPSLYRYCESHLLGCPDDNLKSCFSLAENQLEPYRFCVAVQKDEFPADEDELYRMPKGCNAAAQYLQMSKKVNVVTLLSPLTLVNLLPVEISYEVKGKSERTRGHVNAGKESCLNNVNLAEHIEVSFFLDKDNFPQGNSVTLSPNANGYVTKLKFLDNIKRPLVLTARITKDEGSSITVYLSCPFWIVNKAGVPIVCKQEGTSDEAAGQFQEHEVGRMVAPLLFSFSDADVSQQLALRVGTKLHGDNCKPLWSRSFYLQNGMKVLRLNVCVPSPRSEVVYVVGVEIKSGRGRYRDSKLVTIAPRFTVDNRSSRKVQISQKNFTTSFIDPIAESTHLTLTPNCNLPFHWPRLDKDQLLCVRLADVKKSIWSGGFPIENVDSFHIPVRDYDGACTFLRVEIVLQGPTFFIVLGDTDKLPPPFRVDNFSFVPIIFHQTAVGDERLKLTAKPESCCPFSWDEPTQPSHLTLAAPGDTSAVVTMDNLGFASHLTYENFFYIAFTATFPVEDLTRTPTVGMESLQLVLDVEGNKIILRPKENGKRSQLWRVNADGLIEHEGSSAPREPRKPAPYATILVLDIAGSGPQPTQYTPLMLRKPDNRRASTQHWEFTVDGRLKCEKLENLYVQAKDGFGIPPAGLQKEGKNNLAQWNKWNDVVLGPDQPICYSRTETGIPAEQAVSKQKLRPGSGRLSLTVDTDGPTRVLRIVDVEKPPRSKMLHHEFEENTFNTIPRLLANVNLRNGLGISIVNCKPREELVYMRLSTMSLKYSDSKESELVEVTVESFQIDNQLMEAEKPLAVFVIPTPRYEIDEFGTNIQPALQLSWQRMKSKLNAHVFKTWEVAVKPLSVTIEERLLLKLFSWIGLSEKFESLEGLQESDFEVQRALTNATSLTAKRFYFGELSIHLNLVRLSVLTSSKLSSDLSLIKRRLGLTLIRFEDAQVELDPFLKQHPFETFEFLVASLVKHYRDELVSQAAIILGSTDFLGNPLGFVNDVSVGVSGLIYEGSFGSLFKNVTHGLSNSAAKVTGSLGDGLGRTTLDDKHEEERRKIREENSGSSGEHLMAGLKGFGHGILGGFTSIVAQSIDGASTDGVTGFVAGLGKGIVGTVTKPAVGILDLAAGAASAIRDSSRTSARMVPERVRPPRVATGHGGLLPVFSDMAARGQELLYEVNDRNYSELFIGCETLMSGPGKDLRILVSSQAVTVFKPSQKNQPILRISMSDLIESKVITFPDGKVCIELVRLIPGQRGFPKHNSPQVTCDSETIATRVVQQINYAKVLYEEKRHSQIEKPSSPIEY
ncbi:unnamed protein product [Allacma fusca]|uniref:UBA domain-containing protein n=1 Tax=Allacma fusca TaxID=39272 RepID=A0A8J2NI96_9HEXA|nr:unnamed protein product [Allacma fusca]